MDEKRKGDGEKRQIGVVGIGEGKGKEIKEKEKRGERVVLLERKELSG